MDTKQFQALLANQRAYETPGRLKIHSLARNLRFYAGVLRIVWRSNRLAKRGLYTNGAWSDSSYATLRLIERFGGRFSITGLQNLHGLRSPVVFVANHMSTLENFVLPVLLLGFMPITFVVKRQLLTYPLFGRVMRAVNPIAVDRTNARFDLATVMDEGRQRLARGGSIVIYPQHTRQNAFTKANFNSIGFKLAQRAGVPLVPIALKTDFWSNGKHLKDFGPICPERQVRFSFGAPLSTDARNAHDEAVSFIATHLEQWA